VIPYTQIPALAHFVLEESFVSDVTERPGEVSLRADLCYAKDHPE
jgi:hypothetical protein